jgi:Tol biopolymer transport system component
LIACILPVARSQVENATLAIISADGGQPLKTFAVVPFAWNYKAARWTPDGEAFVFYKTEKQTGNLWKQSLGGGAPKPLTDFKSELIFNHAFSRDGKRIILSRGKYTVTAVVLKNFR